MMCNTPCAENWNKLTYSDMSLKDCTEEKKKLIIKDLIPDATEDILRSKIVFQKRQIERLKVLLQKKPIIEETQEQFWTEECLVPNLDKMNEI